MSRESFQQHYAELKIQVDHALQAALERQSWPEALRRAVEYSLMAGGKRLRPVLVLLASEVCGGNQADALSAACAIEMVHTYSLIHDDLPSMDDDDLRRGRPTSHKVFGEALAILAGDGLLTLAFETLGNAAVPPDVTVECLKTLASAAGGQGMVGGQILDLEAERGPFSGEAAESSENSGRNDCSSTVDSAVSSVNSHRQKQNQTSVESAIHVEQLIQIHRMKTGALITAALELGAATAKSTPEQRQNLRKYGQCAGLAFQIADDLLDVTGNNKRLGKETGRDHELGKLTYPSLIGMTASRAKAESLVDEAMSALDEFDNKADALRQLARFIVERDH